MSLAVEGTASAFRDIACSGKDEIPCRPGISLNGGHCRIASQEAVLQASGDSDAVELTCATPTGSVAFEEAIIAAFTDMEGRR